MKLCEMVFAFHQRRTARSKSEGLLARSTAWTAESAISNASQREWRRMRSNGLMAAIASAARLGVAAFCRFSSRIEKSLYRFVTGIGHLANTPAEQIRIGIFRCLVGLSDGRLFLRISGAKTDC